MRVFFLNFCSGQPPTKMKMYDGLAFCVGRNNKIMMDILQ